MRQADHTDHFLVKEEPIPEVADEVESNVGRLANKFRHSNRVIVQDVYFDLGTNTLKLESTPALEAIPSFMVNKPDAVIEISGHTDNVGKEESNRRISQKKQKQ